MQSDEKLLIDRVNDLYRKCDKYCCPAFSCFMDEGEQMCVSDYFHASAYEKTAWFGGYNEARRRIYGIFPDIYEVEYEMFPVKCIHISFKFGERLSHRDYLGAILSLGLDRSKIGDIIVLDNGAYVFACDDISEYIARSIEKIGRRGVKCILCDLNDIEVPSQEYELIECVSASLRLDAVAAAMLGLSRNDAAKLISDEKVMINHRLRTDGSKDIKEGDVLSVRGFGRFIFDKAGNNTRSGRIHIIVKKYV